MDFAELKNLIGEEGKVIVVEDNKPILVALSYEQYKKEKGLKEDVVQEIEPVEEPPARAEQTAQPSEELTIDDLPL
jgi:hypothetical protein